MNRWLRAFLATALAMAAGLSVSCEPRAIDMGPSAGLVAATVQGPFGKDLAVLASGSHRLAGRKDESAGSIPAGLYVEKRLRQIARRASSGLGGMEIFIQEFPVVQPRMEECRLVVDGREHRIHAARPNVMQASITPQEGLTGRTLYVGKGEVPEYGRRSAQGKIVVVDFDCEGRWVNAFAFGARAVIFIGTPTPTESSQHVNLPANLPRFYVTAEQAKELALRERSREVTIFAKCRWEPLHGRNVIAVLRGTDPKFPKRRSKGDELPEAIVLAAPLDTYGQVPALSPGAVDAGNCAALLQIVEHLAKNRPRRNIIACFFDAQSQCHMGARAFYGAIGRKVSNVNATALETRTEGFEAERRYLEASLELLKQENPFDPEPYVGRRIAEAEEAEKRYLPIAEELDELLTSWQDKADRLEELKKKKKKLQDNPEANALWAEMAQLKPKLLPLMPRMAAYDRTQELSEMAETHHKTFLLALREEARRYSSDALKELRPLRVLLKSLREEIRDLTKKQDETLEEQLLAAKTPQRKAELVQALRANRQQLEEKYKLVWKLRPEQSELTAYLKELRVVKGLWEAVRTGHAEQRRLQSELAAAEAPKEKRQLEASIQANRKKLETDYQKLRKLRPEYGDLSEFLEQLGALRDPKKPSPTELRLAKLLAALPQPDPDGDTPPSEYNFGQIGQLEIEDLSWNSVQALIHKRQLPGEDEAFIRKLFKGIDHKKKYQRLLEVTPERFHVLIRRAEKLFRRRMAEIDLQLDRMKVARALRDVVGPQHNQIVLHLSVQLGDARKNWTFIQGEDSFPNTTDNIANYSAFFKAVRGIHEARLAKAPDFDPRAVSHTYNVRLFAPGKFANSGAIATMFGLPTLSVMTVVDRRPRQGLPIDTPETLNAEAMWAQATQVASFLRHLADDRRLSGKFPVMARVAFCEGKWANNRNTGPSVFRASASGGMRQEPARGAVVAVLGKSLQGTEEIPPGFNHAILSWTNLNGVFEIGPVPQGNAVVIAAGFEDLRIGVEERYLPGRRGLVTGISYATSSSVIAAAVGIFDARSKTIVDYGTGRGVKQTLVMRGLSSASFDEKQHLKLEFRDVLTVYAPFDATATRLFNSRGMVLLKNANSKEEYKGRGISLEDPFDHPVAPEQTARDLLILNEYRLDLLRENRIRQDSLEVLNGQGKDLEEQAAAKRQERSLDWYQATLAAAAALGRRAYDPLVGVMKDLVTAVVLLLLLAMPFAFALERLLVGTPHVYRQIGGFAVFFLAAFGLLFLVNPAFHLAATPIIIFLAFTVILLSVLVISIMLRRLQTEVRKMQGLATTVHSADVSRLSTMLAAVSMGISTMRRRPLRTLLTAVTVLLLTFTILTFASFGSSWGVRRTYEGAMRGAPVRGLVRHPLWTPIGEGVYRILRGALTDQATVVRRYWVSPTAADAQAAITARMNVEMPLSDITTSKMTPVAAAIGLDPLDVQRQPLLADLFADGAKTELLAADGIFLTQAVSDELGLREQDIGKTKVLLDGVALVYGGVVKDAMQSHDMLEGSSILPVDYEASGGENVEEFAPQVDLASELPEISSAQFVTFNVDRVVVVSPGTARRLGGRIRSLTVYPSNPEEMSKVAEYAATILDLPVYYGHGGGAYRLLFTSLAKASGWQDLLIPVVLGGLIIFATMLGSVSDREREIYTFSSLGLAPPHVASLFFAEAAMYAVIGGMGGYLLGQAVARGLAWLKTMGMVTAVPTMNYSSTNAIVTILIVMGTVMVSTIYPAMKASRSANPGVQRAWKIPKPEGNLYDLVFPFTVSAYDITGVVSFLNEHFQNFSDTSVGTFATTQCGVFRQKDNDMLGFEATVALAPFDLGVNQRFAMLSQPSDIEGIDEVRILIYRLSGSHGDWQRSNRVFINDLRKQLLIWRSLTTEIMDQYRHRTLEQWDRLAVKPMDGHSIGEQA